jgi:hypothetical protein
MGSKSNGSFFLRGFDYYKALSIESFSVGRFKGFHTGLQTIIDTYYLPFAFDFKFYQVIGIRDKVALRIGDLYSDEAKIFAV